MADRGPEAHSVGRAPMGAIRNLLLVPTLTARNYSMPCWKVCGGLETGDMWSTLGEHTRASCGKYGAVLPCVRALVVGLWPELLCCIFEQMSICFLFILYLIRVFHDLTPGNKHFGYASVLLWHRSLHWLNTLVSY